MCTFTGWDAALYILIGVAVAIFSAIYFASGSDGE